MADRHRLARLVERPDFVRDLDSDDAGLAAERHLGAVEWVLRIDIVRQLSLLVVLAAAWQVYAVLLANPLIIPSFTEIARAFWSASVDGELLDRAATSIRLLLVGYVAGVGVATVLTLLAVASRVGTDLLSLLTAMFNPLPAIALLPLALLWFGLGDKSLIFVLIHAVLWPLALNAYSGFLGVSETLRMTGQSFGLRGIGYAFKLLIPAAFPAILTGLKSGWAFAWRTLIAAELVFGVSSGAGGLGWFIFQNRNQLETANVFAGLLAVIIIGLLVESLIFRTIERATVRRWGMQR
ncbi:MAG: ABC transporter permease [Rhodospirillales bacterium]|nr:ABC transporter permease [Rhodospirillales bacterium]